MGTAPLSTACLSFAGRGPVARLFVIEARQRGFDGAMSAAPVREDKALETPRLLQDVVEEVAVLAGPIAVHLVVGTHHHAGLPFGDGDLEGQQIGLAHDALIELDVSDIAAGLLVVEGVMFHVGDDLLFLQTLDKPGEHLAGQDRVLSLVFEVASVAGLAHEIDSAADRSVVLLIAQFAPDQGAIFVGQVEIPRGGFREGGRQERGIASASGGSPHADGGIGQLHVGQTEPWNPGNHAGAAIGPRPGRCKAAGPVDQGDLFVQRHLRDDQIGPLVGVQALIHPWTFRHRLRRPLRQHGSKQ